jgi:hypothetical protein
MLIVILSVLGGSPARAEAKIPEGMGRGYLGPVYYYCKKGDAHCVRQWVYFYCGNRPGSYHCTSSQTKIRWIQALLPAGGGGAR